ncbi:unnamed protein product [Danaus chrysippus]|uniref:DNA polymerase delta subunit 3 n=1 Tax=Danaus chrysippus TaxID=151541 RepID=A0A8J2W5E4_9NEOP|nr:unnamed protein product [Danaus chrysippus]
MDKDEIIEAYANTVKEYILDEDKLVTYITLSKDLCIHVNNSKKLLQHVVQNLQTEKANIKLNVNYIVSGLLEDNKAQTKVCTKEDLNIVKTSFKILFYDHIYSVCKGSPVVDNVSYLLLTKFDDFNLCSGQIKGSECVKRSTAEIGNLKTSSQEQIIIETKPLITPAKKNKTGNKDPKLENGEDTKNGIQSEVPPSTVKTEPVTPKKEPTPTKQMTNKTNGHKTQKGIAGFFNKPSIPEIKKAPKETKQIKSGNELKETIKTEEQPMEVDSKPEVIDKKVVKDESKTKSDNVILNKIKKSSKVDKKRKRVLHVSDSDSDTENDPFVDNLNSNIDSIDHSDDEIPATPSASIVKITTGIANPKKKRKIVNKTYTDEDGYILTKKEEVYESCSENEDVPVKNAKVKEEKSDTSPITKTVQKTTKKKVSPPQKGKQSTLTNFFKKV